MSVGLGKQKRKLRKRLSNRRKNLVFPVRGERLEERRLLAAVVTAVSAGAYSALVDYIDAFVDIDQIVPESARNRLQSGGSQETLTYQAYAGEVNDVSISQQIGDLAYVINEGNDDVPIIPVPLAFNPEVINDLGVGFSFVVEVTLDVADVINLPDADAIVPNGTSILDLIPGVGGPDGVLSEMTNLLGEGLTFGLGEIISFIGDGMEFVQDAINTAVGPIISVVGDVVHTACKAIDAIPFVNPDCDDVSNFSESLLTSLADNLNPLPDIPTELLELGLSIIEGLTSTFTTESVLVSTLDGPDNVDLRTLNGVGQLVYAGSGSDVIIAGGGDADVKLYGEEGRDTFIVNFGMDVPRYYVDGGSGNDILSIGGSEGNDIIRVVSSGGALQSVSLEAPNPNQGNASSEVQQITLPANVIGGDFTLSFQGETTTPILTTATGVDVESALEALASLDASNVAVTGVAGGPYTVTFGGSLANTDVPMITANGDNLDVDGSAMAVSTIRLADATQGTNEEQTITLPPTIGSGTFTLDFDGQVTDPIQFDAAATDVRTALTELSNIPPDSVDVTGTAGGPWVVEFRNSLGSTDQPLLTADGTNLISFITAQVTETVTALTGVNEVQRVDVPAGANGGTYRLTFDGDTTAPIPYNATATQVQSALHALNSVGSPSNLVVTPSTTAGYEFDIAFTGDFRGLDQPGITADSDDLRGGVDLAVSSIPNGSGTNEIQSVTTNGATSGTFSLTFDNGTFARTTGPLLHDATAGEIEAALNGLTSIGAGNVSVTGPVGGPWEIEYVADLAATNVPLIELNDIDLAPSATQGVATVTVTEDGDLAGPTDEVQVVSIDADDGTFILRLDSPQTNGLTGGAPLETNAISFNASANDVRIALAAQGLNVTVTGNSGGPYTITFDSASVEGQDIAGEFEVDTTNLIRFTSSVSQTSVAGVNEQQIIEAVDASTLTTLTTTGGEFTLTLGGRTTPPLPYNAAAFEVQTALEALSSIGAGNVSVTGGAGGPWTIEFIKELAKTDIPSIVTNGTQLAGALSVLTVDNAVSAAAGTNEQQQLAFTPLPDSGGKFTLSYNGATTVPITYPTAAGTIENALEALPTIGAGNVIVTGANAGPWTVEFVNDLRSESRPSINVDTRPLETDGLKKVNPDVVIATSKESSGTNELQRISLPAGIQSGTFALEFNGETTADIPYNASRDQVKTALEGLANINVGDVQVFGPHSGPWTVEFTGTLAETDQPLLSAIGTNLVVSGGSLSLIETTQGNDGAASVVLATTTFQEVVSIEQIQIDAGGGDDTIIIEGDTGIAQILVEGGDGTDVLELVSQAAAPNFVAPVFPDGTQATLEMDGQTVQFAGVEGGVVFDAASNAGTIALSGTDEANDIRFQGRGTGAATFANDGQVTLSLRNVGADSEVTILGEQGDDTISVAPNGVTEFAVFVVDGGGPTGANAIRFEGTEEIAPGTGQDFFTYTPDATSSAAGQATYDLGALNLTTIAFSSFSDVAFVGAGGVDELVVNEPVAGSQDTVLFNPEVGNNGSFQFTSQPGGPNTSVVFSPVSYQSIEVRNFDTGSGVDTFSLSSDNLPGVNSEASVVGGFTGVTEARFGDQLTTFTHEIDPANPDILTFEIGTANDVVTVTPGVGITIVVNTALGKDLLKYNGLTDDITLNLAESRISQVGLADVLFTNAETVELLGNGTNALSVLGAALENRYVYAPLSPRGGRFLSGQSDSAFVFDEIGGTFTLGGGLSVRDVVVFEASSERDTIEVDGPGRILRMSDSSGTTLKPVQLTGSIESTKVIAGDGDDSIRVIPTSDLFISVDGEGPNASDRLLIEDTGIGNLVLHREAADGRSGSVTVGDLPPVDYVNVERIDILPLDPLTGGTGTDGLGQLVVFDADPFEHNESLPNRTDFLNLFEIPTNPNIDPGTANGIFAAGPTLPGDEDWYRFDAQQTATLRFELIFTAIGALANGNPGLPGNGELQIEVYDQNNNLIAKFAGEGNDTHTVGVEGGQSYSLRVRGVTPEAINNYDIRVVNLDTIGPQVTNLFITDNPATLADESAYNLFDVKPVQGPTPLVSSLTINIRDLSERFPGFLYGALDTGIAEAVGQYQVVGDHNGIISISSVEVLNDPVVVGQNATGQIILHFTEPLPDDRFTLTVSDNLVDPVGNQLDGESNASEPQEAPTLPSGDSVSKGDFIARFTIDSRAEIGSWSFGSAYIDTNGNFLFDPESQFSDDTNEDIVYKLGFQTDNVFAGNFVTEANATADGFDKLAAYGQVGGVFRWLIDTNNNGVPDLVVADPAQIDGRPFAGNFDGNSANGDEVGLKDGDTWYLDTNHDFKVDTVINSNLVGLPVAGDFDGDGMEDLGAWADDIFSLDLSSVGLDGQHDVTFRFGFSGIRELPFAADFNGDGVDDLGLWNPDGSGAGVSEKAEWYVLMSQPLLSDSASTSPSTFGNSETPSTSSPFQQLFGDEFVPVDPSRDYVFSGELRSGDDLGNQFDPNNRQFFGFASYDADQLLISPWHVNRFGTAVDTRLAVTLKPGDTTITLDDASGWANAGAAHQRTLAWYGYTNSAGFTYPDYTYTRNVAVDFANGMWDAGAITGNVITLRNPWSGPEIQAGEAVRNASSGGTHIYAAAGNTVVPDQWTQYQTTVSGATQFRPGTAFVKPLVLANYQGTSTNLLRIRNVQFLPSKSDVISVVDRITAAVDGTSGQVVNFTPIPFGPDLFASFGDTFSLPIVGNFDPPVVPGASSATEEVAVTTLSATNPLLPPDVDGNGKVEPVDALHVINFLNRHGIKTSLGGLQVESNATLVDPTLMLAADADGSITAVDALAIIHAMNRRLAAGRTQGEATPIVERSAVLDEQPREAGEETFDQLDKQGGDHFYRIDRRENDQALAYWNALPADSRDEESDEMEALLDQLASDLG